MTWIKTGLLLLTNLITIYTASAQLDTDQVWSRNIFYMQEQVNHVQIEDYLKDQIDSAVKNEDDLKFIEATFCLGYFHYVNEDSDKMIEQFDNIINFTKYDAEIKKSNGFCRENLTKQILLNKFNSMRLIINHYMIAEEFSKVLPYLEIFIGKYRINLGCDVGGNNELLYEKYLQFKAFEKNEPTFDTLFKYGFSNVLSSSRALLRQKIAKDVMGVVAKNIYQSGLAKVFLNEVKDIRLVKNKHYKLPHFYIDVQGKSYYLFSEIVSDKFSGIINKETSDKEKNRIFADMQKEYESLLNNPILIRKLKEYIIKDLLIKLIYQTTFQYRNSKISSPINHLY